MEAEKLEKEQLRRTKNQAIRKDNIAYDNASYSKLFIQQKLKEKPQVLTLTAFVFSYCTQGKNAPGCLDTSLHFLMFRRYQFHALRKYRKSRLSFRCLSFR